MVDGQAHKVGGAAAQEEEEIQRAMRESMRQHNPGAQVPGEDEIERAIRES